jgi:tRNA (guanine26-N2/guanine27-N2)-dimethyltransferase
MKTEFVCEGKAKLQKSGSVFYNPHMEFCRDISSLAVGAVGEKISICDSFCASGIRGIRYKRENGNAQEVAFVDMNKEAYALARKNAKANRVKGKVHVSDARKFFLEHEFDFLELDPFGTPAPYLPYAFNSFRAKKIGYVSATATDVAVLCGAHSEACLKVYQAHPIDNEFCHENGIRILLGKMAREAAGAELGIEPLVSFSHRHYMKIIVRVKKGAKEAVESVRKLGYIGWCSRCLFRNAIKLPETKICPECGNLLEFAGPLWLGELSNREFVEKMRELNKERKYANEKAVEKMLSLISEECGMPPAYYDLHSIVKKLKQGAVGSEPVMESLRADGYRCAKTHFNPNAIKTDAPLGAIKEIIRELKI